MNGFSQLVWREWRCNRTMLVVTIALLAVLLAMGLLANEPTTGPTIAALGFARWLVNAGVVAAFFTVLFGTVLLPLVAANMIAGERADRSAAFIAALPVSRGVRLAAKGAFLAAVTVAIWAPILSIVEFVRRSDGPIGRDTPAVLGLIATFTLLAMAIAWLAAAWFESPVIAAAAAIAVPLAAPMVIFKLPALPRLPAFQSQEGFYSLWITAGGMPQPLTLLVAAALFAAGSALYLRRLE